MSEKHLICKGATVYCNKSVSNNNPGTAIPLNITSQTTVEINGEKVVATDKDCSVANMNFVLCSKTNPPTPCTANIQWRKVSPVVNISNAGLKLLTEESEGMCSSGGGKVKFAFHGQTTTPQKEEANTISNEILCTILPTTDTESDVATRIDFSNKATELKEIVKIEILDDNRTAVGENFIQLVNLPQNLYDDIPANRRYIDGAKSPIKGKYQLGTEIKYQITLEGVISKELKLYLVANSDDYLTYSPSEASRNSKFAYKIPNSQRDQKGEANNRKILLDETPKNLDSKKVITGRFSLTQIGGNKYHLSLEDNSGEVVAKSVEFTTWRMLFFVELKMQGLTNIVKHSVLKEEYNKHFITLNSLAEETVDYFKNITDPAIEKLFFENIEKVCQKYKKIASYCINIATIDMYAEKCSNVLVRSKDNVIIGEGQSDVVIPIFNEQKGEEQELWYNIDSNTDWFISGRYISNCNPNNSCDLLECEVIPLLDDGYENCSYLSIDVEHLASRIEIDPSIGVDFGVVELRINTIDLMNGGISFHDYNVIVIASQTWWQPREKEEQNQSMIHEIGHQLDMVPAGKKGVDKPKNYYGDSHGKNHLGPHCKSGEDDKGQPICIMFGGNHKRRTTSFCADCSKCLRKTDVTSCQK